MKHGERTITVELPEMSGVAERPGTMAEPEVPEVLPDTAVFVECEVEGRSDPVRLPIIADTVIVKNSRVARGSAKRMGLRDNRYTQGLLMISTEPLPDKAKVLSARLKLRVLKTERPTGFSLRFHKILTVWDEKEANWYEPALGAVQWDGMAPGRDYVKEPFASINVEEGAKDGTVLTIDGFGPIVQEWLDGKPNNGIQAELWGSAIQLDFDASEQIYSRPDPSEELLPLGWSTGHGLVADINLPLLRRVLLKADDLKNATLQLNLDKQPADSDKISVVVRQVTGSLPEDGSLPAVGSKDLQEVFIKDIKLIDLTMSLREALAGKDNDFRILLMLKVPDGVSMPELQVYPPQFKWRNRRPTLSFTVAESPSNNLFPASSQPQDGVYVQAKGGNLYYGEDRLRLWGVTRHRTDAFNVGRLKRMGFNAIRMWGDHDFYDTESAKRGEFRSYTKGNNSDFDKFDRAVFECRNQGLWIVSPSMHYLGRHMIPGAVQDGSCVSGGSDWEQWREAIREKGSQPSMFKYFDPRMRKIYFQNAYNFLNHVNPYTGRRYAEEEIFVTFELGNEVAFLKWALERGFDDWPDFFREELKEQWNDWLGRKYGGDIDIKEKWGELGSDESLEKGTIALAPSFSERNRYSEARGSDFLRFMIGLVDSFHEELREYCRRQAPAGVGVNVIPFLYDTQYRFSMPWQFTNSKADVMSFGMYINTMDSTLGTPPGIYVVDSTSVKDKPVILYEVNQNRPNPYRAEFPIKLATLSSWEDWDGVFWHYWDGELQSDLDYLAAPIPYPLMGPNGYWGDGCIYHSKDPSMTSAMAMGGRLFLSGAVEPAPDPVIYKVGKNAPYSYKWFNGINMRDATFAYGAHIEFDPGQEEDLKVIGEESAGRIEEAIAAGNDIIWDWPNSRLIVDTPTAKFYVGPPMTYRFKDGIVLSNMESEFAAFMLASLDGRPLTGDSPSQRMLCNAVFDSRNSNFSMNLSGIRNPTGFVPVGEQVGAILNRGHAPAVSTPVPFELYFPQKISGRLRQYDFGLREFAANEFTDAIKVKVDDNGLRWMSLLEIDSRGAAVDTTLPAQIGKQETYRKSTVDSAWSEATDVYNPLDIIGWETGYLAAHQKLRDSNLSFTNIGREAPESGVITLSDAEVILNSPANIEIRFINDRMSRIAVTFTKAPPFEEAMKVLTGVLGRPVSATLAEHAWADSFCRWEVHQPHSLLLAVELKEFQGTLGLTYELKVKTE